MDPVLPPTLFDVLDLLASTPRQITLEDLNVRRRVTIKRLHELGRILEGFGVAHRDGSSLVPDPEMTSFVRCWEEADLECINRYFAGYRPYKKFLRFIEAEGCIEIPGKGDIDVRQALVAKLKAEAGLTFVAVDTFKWWGLCVGRLYLAHANGRKIYWGGARPSLCAFEKSLQNHYIQIRPRDGFANVGELADRVCRELYISFIHFEELFNKIFSINPGVYIAGTSLARPSPTKALVQTLTSRTVAKRLSSSLRPGEPIEWTEKRRIEDGIVVGRRSVKMLKIQSEVIR